MKKLLASIGCGLLLVAMVAGAAFGDATLYRVDSTLQTNGWEREGQRMQTTADGRIWGVFRKTNSSTAKLRVFYSNTGATSFTRSADLFNVVNTSDATSMFARGDTVTFWNSFNAPTVFGTVAEWCAFTGNGVEPVFDSIGHCETVNWYGSIGTAPRLFGDGMVSYLSIDSVTGETASKRLYEHRSDRSGGWQQDPLTWLCHDYRANSSYGSSFYYAIPYRATGTMIVNLSGQSDLAYFDTTGISTVSDFASNIVGTQGLGSSWRQSWPMPYGKPSSGIAAYGYEVWDTLMEVAVISNGGRPELHFYAWTIQGGTTPTGVTNYANVTLMATSSFPTTITDSTLAEAVCTVDRTTGYIYVIAKTWPDTAAPATYGLSYWVSTNKGVSFGSAQTFKSAGAVTGSERAHRITDLIAPYAANDKIIAAWKQGGASAGLDTLIVGVLSLSACPDYTHSLSVPIKTNTSAYFKNSVGNASAPVDSLFLQLSTTNFGTVAFSGAKANAAIPDSIQITGLTQDTKYYYRWIALDAGCRDTSQVDSITTYKTITQSLASSAVTSVSFTVTNTFVANTVTKHRLLRNTSNDMGTATVADSATTALTSPKALNATGLSASTKYYVWWQIFDELGTTASAVDSVTTSGADSSPPAAFTSFAISRINSLNADTISIVLGANGDADLQKCKVRYSTSSYPATVNDGTSLFDTSFSVGGLPNLTSERKFVFTTTEPSWVYVACFAGDEVPNWSASAKDSIYAPALPSGGGGVDMQALIIRMDSMAYLFSANNNMPQSVLSMIANAIYNYTQDNSRLMRVTDTADFILAWLNHKLPPNTYLNPDTSIGAFLNAYGAYGWDINNVPLAYVSNVANLQPNSFDDSSATAPALTEIAQTDWTYASRTLTAEIWTSAFRDSVLSAIRDTKWATNAGVWTYGGGRSLTDKANFTLASTEWPSVWNVSASYGFTGGSMGANLTNPNFFTGTSINYSAMADAVWGKPWLTDFPAGSMGDSLSNPSYVQGSSGLTPTQIADAILNASRASYTTVGSVGEIFDAKISSRSSHSVADIWAYGTRALTDKIGFSLADYNAFWNVPWTTNFTTNSMGDKLTDSSFVQGTAAGLTVAQIVNGILSANLDAYAGNANSLGSRVDQKISLSGGGGGGGTGTGAFSVNLTIVDTSVAPDSVVANVPIYVSNLAQNGALYSTVTTNNGTARFNLSAGSWLFFTNAAGYAAVIDTLVLTAAKNDTLRVRRDNSGRTVVSFSMISPTGNPYPYAKLTFSLRSVNDSLLRTANNTVVSDRIIPIVTADFAGVANVPLYPNSTFTNDSSFYTVEIRDSRLNRIIETWAFRVESSATAVQFNTITRWRP